MKYLGALPKDAPVDFSAFFSSDQAAGTGNGVTANGTAAANAHQTQLTPPTANLGPNGPSGSGGTAENQAAAKGGGDSLLKSPWFWLGMLLECAAAGLYLAPKFVPGVIPFPVPTMLPLGLAAAGGLCIFAAFTSPIIAALCVCVGVLLILAPSIIHAIQTARQKAVTGQQMGVAAAKIGSLTSGLRAAADGIATLPETVKATVLNSISHQAEADKGDHQTIESHVDPTLPPIRVPRDVPKAA